MPPINRNQYLLPMVKKRPAFGNYTWVDLVSTRPKSTEKFFHDVFGWKMADDEKVEGFTFYTPTAEPEGGIRKPMMKGEPPCVLPYIGVKSIDKTVAKIKSAGGKILVPKTEIPPGWLAIFRAPGGVVQGLLQYK
jgi:predicted enzyme related to lactoylglutathione lyase